MASSFSERERVRRLTVSLPESFQFFSVGACSHWLVLLDGSPGAFLPQAFHGSPMSDMGQTEQYSKRADIFRSSADNGWTMISRWRRIAPVHRSLSAHTGWCYGLSTPSNCSLPTTVRDAGAWIMFSATPYSYLHICGTPWEGNEYSQGDEARRSTQYTKANI
jgi:hypothetical protein